MRKSAGQRLERSIRYGVAIHERFDLGAGKIKALLIRVQFGTR